MRKKAIMLIVLLFAFGQGAMAWDGLGTSTNPYRIQDSNDWKQLADEVLFGNSFSSKYFEMTADIDAGGVSVGADGRPFSGIFDGYSHTLTYNRGYSGPGAQSTWTTTAPRSVSWRALPSAT